MKRYNNLYEKIYNLDNLKEAHQRARRGKSHYREVVKMDARQDQMLYKLHHILKDMSFITSPYSIFIKKGRKDRVIHKLPYFPDRIVHHAIMNVIEPIWTKTFIRDTYASISGRGLHDGANRVKHFLKNPIDTKHCLKMDIKKFYPSVDNAILKKVIRKKIKCQKTLSLLDGIIDSERGVPIGNYLSQYLANLYLSDFDHWIKEVKRIPFYSRYCDDMILLNSNKENLHNIRKDISNFLNNTRKLKIKENWQIFPVESRGIDFLGYIFRHNNTRIRKNIVATFKQKIKRIKKIGYKLSATKIINMLMSYYGWFLHADNGKYLWQQYVDSNIQLIVNKVCKRENILNPILKMENLNASIKT